MHLYFLTRGIKQQRELFAMFMQSQMYKWTRKNNKTNKDEVCQVQGSLRPIEFWEYVFPEECLAEVLTMLDIKPVDNRWAVSGLKASILRKVLGHGDSDFKVEKIPKYEPVFTNRFVEKRGVAIYPIGVKKDARGEMMGFDQELL